MIFSPICYSGVDFGFCERVFLAGLSGTAGSGAEVGVGSGSGAGSGARTGAGLGVGLGL